MYNHAKQYKCTIIRARAISEADDLLPKYATVIDNLCPCTKREFDEGFNKAFYDYALSKARDKNNRSAIKKTLDNHRTEVSGKLFGMYYEIDGMVYSSERTKKYLEDYDQPAFFKDWLIKMQFPNGMQKPQTYLKLMSDGIYAHPYSLLLKVLQYARREGISLTKQEIGYYILNSEDVLKNRATPNEVFDQILIDKRSGIEPRKIIIPEGESSSYAQHTNDQLQYLSLANLIFINDQEVSINIREDRAIQEFISLIDKPLEFDVYSYELSTAAKRHMFEMEWAIYYSKLSSTNDELVTPVDALISPEDETTEEVGPITPPNTLEIGDEGEAYVYEYEKLRVGSFNPRLTNKVIALGRTKGLGYDIQSVIAEHGPEAEFYKYIEVKATKRVTAPDITDDMWVDTINITRNEWIAAQQHKEFYFIYRVYFIRGEVIVYILRNLYQKNENHILSVVPLTYRIDFKNNAVDNVIKEVVNV